jgi:FkbM family methyltransferase
LKIKDIVRKILIKLPFPLTENIKTDQQTNRLLSQILKPDSNCIDVGCHKGEIMDEIIKNASNGEHFGFEPIPYLFNNLLTKYKNKKVTIYPYALSNIEGKSQFNLVTTNPAYSGLMKRNYDRPEEDTTIDVEVKLLDNLIDPTLKIDFIKIDTEGAELLVLQGASSIMTKWKPTVLFEFGLGASDVYGTTPKDIFHYFNSKGLSIYTLKSCLSKEKTNLTLEEFDETYHSKLDYIFVAMP